MSLLFSVTVLGLVGDGDTHTGRIHSTCNFARVFHANFARAERPGLGHADFLLWNKARAKKP